MAERGLEGLVVGIGRALYMNRLHVLRLTEVVRFGVRPNDEGVMLLAADLDDECRQRAFDFVLATFPHDFHLALIQARPSWTEQ